MPQIVSRRLAAMPALGITLLCAAHASAASYKYITLDPPGTTESIAGAINNAGQVVIASGDKAYIWKDGVFTRLNRITEGGHVYPTSISPWGLVVGYATTLPFEGFAYSTIQHRAYSLNINHLDTYPNAINGAGQVVGFIDTPDDKYLAFLYQYGKYTFLTPPAPSGIGDATANWLNDSGQVVGYYDSVGHGYTGYSYYKGQYTLLKAPGGLDVYPYFVNASGDITGALSNNQGFILSKGKYRIVTGTTDVTEVLALNAHGEAIGNHLTNSPDGYFSDIFRISDGVARPANPPVNYITAFVQTGGLNEAGSFIGTYVDDSAASKTHAFVAVCDPPGSRCGD